MTTNEPARRSRVRHHKGGAVWVEVREQHPRSPLRRARRAVRGKEPREHRGESADRFGKHLVAALEGQRGQHHFRLEVQRPLAEALVSDVAGEPGGLPLLSTTLLQLWRARDGHTLRYASYQAGGGVRGAVARLAEDATTGSARPTNGSRGA